MDMTSWGTILIAASRYVAPPRTPFPLIGIAQMVSHSSPLCQLRTPPHTCAAPITVTHNGLSTTEIGQGVGGCCTQRAVGESPVSFWFSS